MNIQGFTKTSLLDYPEHLAAVIFTPGCNYRCPFCHNTDLVLSGITDGDYDENDILEFLKKRRGILEGVCITGGEPTLQPDLLKFIAKIRELGYKIKLDSNGYRPDVLQEITDGGLVDYIAMDIKNSPAKYALTCGISNFHFENILKSIDILKSGNIEYEFRTTVVKELHTLPDMLQIADLIKGCRHYFIQSYIDSGNILVADHYSAYSAKELLKFMEAIMPVIPVVKLRGVDVERTTND